MCGYMSWSKNTTSAHNLHVAIVAYVDLLLEHVWGYVLAKEHHSGADLHVASLACVGAWKGGGGSGSKDSVSN